MPNIRERREWAIYRDGPKNRDGPKIEMDFLIGDISGSICPTEKYDLSKCIRIFQ